MDLGLGGHLGGVQDGDKTAEHRKTAGTGLSLVPAVLLLSLACLPGPLLWLLPYRTRAFGTALSFLNVIAKRSRISTAWLLPEWRRLP